MSDYKKAAAEVFYEMARMIKTGESGQKISLGLSIVGSEIPAEELLQGARDAMRQDRNLEVVIIGPYPGDDLPVYQANSDEEVAASLEDLLDRKILDAVVTMHYPFPIGVATVGKVITPARGKPMYIATTTGTSAADRVQAMVKNAVYGIAVARADGIKNPTVGILNVEGARQVERQLESMRKRGYSLTWGNSQRSDGGHVLRGNDLITGSVDVLVTDTLTGNILMKLFSSFNSGGNYETVGFGYGPGIGEDFDRLILILSRASGRPVVAGAIQYAAAMVRGKIQQVKETEINQARQADWNVKSSRPVAPATAEDLVPPPPKVVDTQIPGIDILELEDAVKALWKEEIFASSGMGCTGPVILVAGEDHDQALKILNRSGYL
jgi:glycine reductase